MLTGTLDEPLAVPPGRGRRAGLARRWTGRSPPEHGLSASVALLVKDRDAGTDARVALEEALR